MAEFVSIDVETANTDLSSVCQVGIACYDNRKLIDEWETYVDPEDAFDYFNCLIHGIEKGTIFGAPKFPEIIPALRKYLENQICISHTSFDRLSIYEALFKYRIDKIPIRWLDSSLVARRAWEEFAYKGWGLRNICSELGYKFHHHDALEDAKAAGFIMLSAIEKTGLDAEAWLTRVKQPLNNESSSQTIKRQGNPNGSLYGEVLVFTGVLSLPRNEAASIAANLGCQVDETVTKRTTLLVIGDQDIKKLAGYEKSSKQRTAEKLIAKGHSIRLLQETDFKKLIEII